MLFQNLSIVLNAALRGIGKTKIPFLSSICMAAVDILVNYLLIEGHWGCPRLELVGDDYDLEPEDLVEHGYFESVDDIPTDQ